MHGQPHITLECAPSPPPPFHVCRCLQASLNQIKLYVAACAQAAREGLLSRAANACGSMHDAVATFHAGAFYMFYDDWVAGKKTMKDSGER